MGLQELGNLIVIAFKNLFWWILDLIANIAIGIIDFIAGLLPDYTIPAPSAVLSSFPIVPTLNWIFPVDHFVFCVSIIVVNMGISFVYGPLLRFVRIAK
jgi:hypothetical protein